MTQQLYIIGYENAHWCGGQLHCVVWAKNEDDAVGRASSFMDQEQYDLFSDHYDEDPEMDDGIYAAVNSVELLADSRLKEFYDMPDQREAFYPCVNPEDAPK